MKRLLYTIAALLLAGGASGQAITISSYKSIMVGAVDSCAVPTPAALAALPALGTPATNASWDLSGVALQSSFVTYAYRAKTSGFPTATYIDSATYSLAPSATTSYKAWRNIEQSSTGVFLQGDEVLTRQAKSLSSVTMNTLDSIIFPTQVISYNTRPLRIFKFPSTIGTVWLDSTARNVSFNLTVTAASLSNAPGMQKQRRIFLDSVVGWGTMKVPIVGKTKSTAIPVLQIHHRDIAIDSFFVNGVPAPVALLAAMGISQGQTTTVSRTFFYRDNATRPLIELVHSTPSHSSSATTFYIHAVDLTEATGVPGVAAPDNVRIYPNPLRRNGVLHIDIPGSAAGSRSYSLINVAGQEVARGALPGTAAGHSSDISLPQGLQPGTYYMTLHNSGERETILPLTIE